ncbi:hypothetical protein SDC9_05903 [bioreactor metagenome]|uniref:Uncharacterized protein n=1 Tax=bioreactor metagenome TaxID=1076179 RepID=A0A644T0H0_9ZZZZ|nr:hypothetical protein [Negativicutes bacterium]
MEINSAKRKQLRRKYKRHAAAVMGVAIMTGAVLSGLPTTKSLAAEAPSNRPPIKNEQSKQVTKDSRPPGHGWHQHKYSWPSPDENQAWYQDGKIYYRSDNNNQRNHRNEYSYYVNNPVNYVKNSATIYGFDSSRDSFTLLTVSPKRALVEVRKHDTGQLYNVLLERANDHNWKVINVRAL